MIGNMASANSIAKSNSKWKDALLKTSLPLEHLVAEKLGKQKFDIWGEFSFVRENEHGLETEFSVDLHKNYPLMKSREHSFRAPNKRCGSALVMNCVQLKAKPLRRSVCRWLYRKAVASQSPGLPRRLPWDMTFQVNQPQRGCAR